MSKNDELNKCEKIKPIDISGGRSVWPQFIRIYDSPMLKRIADSVSNPIIAETQKMFSKYDKMIKPLHMESLSEIGKIVEVQNVWIKNYGFSGYKNLTGSINNIMKENSYNVSETIRGLNKRMESLRKTTNFSKTSFFSLSAMFQEAGNISLASQMLKSNSAFSALSQRTLKDININLLGKVTDRVLSESEEWNFDMISETIAMEYEKESDSAISEGNQDNQIKRKIDVKEVRNWLSFIVTIVSVILGIISKSSLTTISNYNYAQQVNNYYIVGMGYDAKELNMKKYRIVNRESIVRLKHDCHSHVIGILEEGEIIKITDKYKKWRKIYWEDGDGRKYVGWIQNYKLTEFNNPKLNMKELMKTE